MIKQLFFSLSLQSLQILISIIPPEVYYYTALYYPVKVKSKGAEETPNHPAGNQLWSCERPLHVRMEGGKIQLLAHQTFTAQCFAL